MITLFFWRRGWRIVRDDAGHVGDGHGLEVGQGRPGRLFLSIKAG